MKTNRFLAAAGISLALALTFSCSGDDGKDGSDCSLNGKVLTCGDQSFTIQDGSENGTDGVSIVWKGELATAPNKPEKNWAYYNTVEKKSYIWNGTAWQTLAKDGSAAAIGEKGENGKDGTNGKNGIDGTDGRHGISIVWKGELATAPESPEINWAYYNTVGKKSYIWGGTAWHVLAQDGSADTIGEKGADGTDGADGAPGQNRENCVLTEDRSKHVFEIQCEDSKTSFGFCGPNSDYAWDVYYTDTQFCQPVSYVVKPFCGTATYPASDFCQSPNVTKPFCGTTTYTAEQFCQSPDVVETLCGTTTYTALEFCQSDDVVETLCGTATYTAEQFCQSPDVVEPLCGSATYTTAQFCYNGKVGDFCGGRGGYDSDIFQCKPEITASGIYLKTKPSDGHNSFEAVLIGTQVWMAEDLMLYEWADAKLYKWLEAVVTGGSNTDPSGIKGICPEGWHVPSRAEVDALISYVTTDNSGFLSSYLKATSGWGSGLGNGSDKYGFSAIPNKDGSFFMWSTTTPQVTNANSIGYEMNPSDNKFEPDLISRESLLAVRCVKDNPQGGI